MMEKWKQLCGKIGKDRFLILIIGGLLLLVITYPLPSSSKKEGGGTGKGGNTGVTKTADASSGSNNASRTDTKTDYTKETEARLAGVLSNINGAGKVQVFLSFSDFGMSVVEKDVSYTRNNEDRRGEDTQNTSVLNTENSEETIYTTDESGNKVPFVNKITTPRVSGVLVVAQGGGNENIQKEMKEAIMALFGIEEHKIKVVKMKGEER